MAPAFDSIYSTFSASIHSVGTAMMLAFVGVYLHRRGFLAGEGKRTLALISQQVTFPLFLFTKILYCNQDWSEDPCPDITKSLEDVWLLVFWPAYVVLCGLLVGYWVTKVTNTPKSQIRSVLAACAFGNSTGLPITLLIVVHDNFPESSDLGRIDPTLFLSVYLLVYPILQWGIGGWLLAPQEEENEQKYEENASSNGVDNNNHHHHDDTPSSPLKRSVLNNKETKRFYNRSRRGMSETDASLYISDSDLVTLASQWAEERPTTVYNGNLGFMDTKRDQPSCKSEIKYYQQGSSEQSNSKTNEMTALLAPNQQQGEKERNDELDKYEVESVWETINKILVRWLQPPVIGAILGVTVAATPVRGIFVDIVDRSSHAPLQWLFDALYTCGQAAVPINMMILGCNLSASYQLRLEKNDIKKSKLSSDQSSFSYTTMVGIVFGKMVVMPVVGLVSAIVLDRYLLDIYDANNVMVMVELSGSNTKEAIARSIAFQYAVAPIILSLTMTMAVGFASRWS